MACHHVGCAVFAFVPCNKHNNNTLAVLDILTGRNTPAPDVLSRIQLGYLPRPSRKDKPLPSSLPLCTKSRQCPHPNPRSMYIWSTAAVAEVCACLFREILTLFDFKAEPSSKSQVLWINTRKIAMATTSEKTLEGRVNTGREPGRICVRWPAPFGYIASSVLAHIQGRG